MDPALIAQDWMVVRHTMWNYVGLLRSDKRLDRAGRILSELQVEIEDFYRRGTMSDELLGLRNGVQTALAIHRAASEQAETSDQVLKGLAGISSSAASNLAAAQRLRQSLESLRARTRAMASEINRFTIRP